MKLKSYSALAAATLTSAAAAQGQILYTDLNPDETFLHNHTYTMILDLDLDGDGIHDLQFRSNPLSYGIALEAEAVNPDWGMAGKFFSSFFNSCTGNYIRGANSGLTIDGNLSFMQTANLMFNTFPCGDITDWNQGDVKYMALRKTSGSDAYYGWLRVERKPDVGFSELFHFRDHALNLTANQPVAAGDPGLNCLVPEKQQSTVSGSSVYVTWEKVYGATSYEVVGRKLPGTTTKTKIRPNNNLNIPFLNPGDYAWKVKANCVSGASAYSPEDSFNVPTLRFEELISGESLTIRPNPAGEFARLDLHEFVGIEKATLYNMQGQVLWSEKTTQSVIELPVAELPAGTYIIQVQFAGGVQSGYLVRE